MTSYKLETGRFGYLTLVMGGATVPPRSTGQELQSTYLGNLSHLQTHRIPDLCFGLVSGYIHSCEYAVALQR